MNSTTTNISRTNQKRASLKKPGRVGWLFIAPALTFVILFFLIPVVNVILMSFQNYPLLGARSWIGIENFKEAFTSPEFIGSAKITLLYTVIVTPLLFFTALLMALLVQGDSRLTRLFRTIFFLPVVIGFASASLMWYWFVDARVGPLPQILRLLRFGTFDDQFVGVMPLALFMVILLVVWKFSSFQMILLMAAIQGIPTEIMEAAEVDGVRGFKLLRTVTLPLIRRTLALVLILSVAGSLLAFDQFYIITGGGPSGATITTVFDIYRQSFTQFRLGYGASLSVILAVILMAIASIQLRILRNPDEE
jgi:multiple sugar transport system permease protein